MSQRDKRSCLACLFISVPEHCEPCSNGCFGTDEHKNFVSMKEAELRVDAARVEKCLPKEETQVTHVVAIPDKAETPAEETPIDKEQYGSCQDCVYHAEVRDGPHCTDCWYEANKPNFKDAKAIARIDSRYRGKPAESVIFNFHGRNINLHNPPKETTMETGLKHDTGKPPMSLIPTAALIEEAKVLAFGAQKYSAHNWRKGIQFSQLVDAAMRHLTAWKEGEIMDAESGLSHLAHARCCLGFLLEYTEGTRKREYDLYDDLWKGGGPRNSTE